MALTKNDLSGKTINGLQILQEISQPNRHKKLKCICICGRIFFPFKQNVLRGLSKKCLRCANKKSKVGLRIGKIQVISEVIKDKKRGVFYQCKCDCGNIFIKNSNLIRNLKGCKCPGCPTKPKPLSREESTKIAGFKKHLSFRSTKVGVKTEYLKIKKFSHWIYDKTRRRPVYLALCKCGKLFPIRGDHIFRIKSCGCLQHARQPKGEDQARSLFSNKEVKMIKDLLAIKIYTNRQIAKMFNVSEFLISAIKRGISYKSIL